MPLYQATRITKKTPAKELNRNDARSGNTNFTTKIRYGKVTQFTFIKKP